MGIQESNINEKSPLLSSRIETLLLIIKVKITIAKSITAI